MCVLWAAAAGAAGGREPAVLTEQCVYCGQLLLERRADVNQRNDDGRTALHFATWNSHPRAAAALLA